MTVAEKSLQTLLLICIYNAEKANAKAALDAGKLQTDARRIQALSGVQGSLQTTLGQIYGNQTTNMLITNANRTMNFSKLLCQ